MNKKAEDCCYQEMTKSTGGQSIPSEYHNPPMVNEYENSRKGWNVGGYDQSGMRGNKNGKKTYK